MSEHKGLKVLCEFSPGGSVYVRTGWKNVFEYCGHEWRWWDPRREPAFDAFRWEPDIFLGTTYGTDNAVYKNILARPEMKVALFGSNWGSLTDSLDRHKYPLVYVTENEKRLLEDLKKKANKPDFVFIHITDSYLDATMGGWNEIGIKPVGILNAGDIFAYSGAEYREELACDVGFCGGYWPYKGQNLGKYLLPLCYGQQWNIKVFGGGWPVYQSLGILQDDQVKHLFKSARVCPNVSEPHSQIFPDLVERIFKVMLVGGGICISDYVEGANEIFSEFELPMAHSPSEFKELIHTFLPPSPSKTAILESAQKTVLQHHTYFERVGKMFEEFNLPDEAAFILEKKLEVMNRVLLRVLPNESTPGLSPVSRT